MTVALRHVPAVAAFSETSPPLAGRFRLEHESLRPTGA
jgi:hypothetical protein